MDVPGEVGCGYAQVEELKGALGAFPGGDVAVVLGVLQLVGVYRGVT